MVALFLDTTSERSQLFFYESELLFLRKFPVGLNNSKYIFPAIQEGLQELNIAIKDLSFIAVGTGPGSYTGMRVGAAVAQGLSFGCQLPLIGVPSLTCYAPDVDGSFLVLVDARTRGAYMLKGALESGVIKHVSEAKILPLSDLGSFLEEVDFIITPNDQLLRPKVKELFPSNNCSWMVSWQKPEVMAHLAFARLQGLGINHEDLELIYP